MVAVALLSMLAAPGERLSVHINYQAPAECPPLRRVEGELSVRSAKLELVDDSARAAQLLHIVIRREKKQFVGTSSLHGAREFKAPRCDSVLGAISLATALLLDPEGARTGPVTAEEIEAAPVRRAEAEVPPPPSDPPAEPPAQVRPAVESPPAPPPPPSTATAETVPATANNEPTGWEVTVLLGGGLLNAVSGAVEPSFGAAVAVRRGPLAAQLEPLFLLGRRVSSSNGSAQYRAFGGRLELTAALRWAWLLLLPGVQLTVLGVPIVSPDAEEPRPGTSWLVAPGPVAHAQLCLGAWRVGLQVGVGVQLRREQYVVMGAGPVFSAPVWFGFAGLGVGRTIP